MPDIGDVVLIYIQNKASAYARIEGIEPDIKPRWYQVRLLFLGFPPQETTWILKKEYLDGSPFSMKDIPIQITTLEKPSAYRETTGMKKDQDISGGEVISIEAIRAKKHKKDHTKE